MLAGDATGLQRRGQRSDDGLMQARLRGSQSTPCSVLPRAPPSSLTASLVGNPHVAMRLSFPKVNPKSLPCDWPSAALVICRPDSLPDLQHDEEALHVTGPAHTPRGTCSLEEGPLGATSEAAGHQRERVTRAGHLGREVCSGLLVIGGDS